MRLHLATLPLHAVDLDGRLSLRLGADGDDTARRVVVLGLGADALIAAAPHLGASLTLTLCDGAPDVPPPVPSRDELAARLAECERELADVTRQRDAADSAHAALSRWAQRVVADIHALADGKPLGPRAPEYGHSLADDLRAIAARIDREPPQRAPGVVAGVAADAVDGWRVALPRATRGAGRVSIAMGDAVAEARQRAGRVSIAMGDAVAEARQRAGGGEGRGERVEGAQQGAADVGGVAERVVVAEGTAGVDTLGSAALVDGVPTYEMAADIRRVVRQHEGRRVRLVLEVLRGEGGGVHSESVSPTAATGECAK